MAVFTEMFGNLVRRRQANGGEMRLGAGVVGHTTRVVLASVVAIGVLALILERDTPVAINAIIAIAGVTAYYLNGTWKFADKHPDAAALAGTSWPKAEAKSPSQPAQPPKVEPATMRAGNPPAATPSPQRNGGVSSMTTH